MTREEAVDAVLAGLAVAKPSTPEEFAAVTLAYFAAGALKTGEKSNPVDAAEADAIRISFREPLM